MLSNPQQQRVMFYRPTLRQRRAALMRSAMYYLSTAPWLWNDKWSLSK